MAVDINKLIADAKAKQAAANAAAAKAQAEASKNNTDAETRARSKSQTDYANTLKPRLKDYESQLEIWAKKIARGDKLSSIEQKEFDRLVKDYNSLNKTIDAAIKKSNDILVEARKTSAAKSTTSKTPATSSGPSGPSGPTGTTATAPAQTQTSEPVETKPKVTTETTTDANKIALAKKEAARTKALGKISSQGGVVASDYAERNAGFASAAAAAVGDREAIALGAAAASDFALPQTLFDNIPSLKLLLEKFVKTPGMTMDAFRKELRNDLWFKQNSDEIKARYVQYYNFRDLQASGRAQGTTDYEMQIAKIEANLKKRAVEIGSAAANDPTALRKAAENLYITNKSEDTNFIDGFLAASIKTVAGKIGGQVTEGYSGEALSNYKLLVSAARDNGFQLSDIIPGGATEQQVLQGIATGTIDINRVIADARKLAAQGQPQYVRDLLAQGYTLKQVLSPYRQTMANVLEIQDPEQIGLNDPLLRSAITDKGDMNMYEFKKALRRDNRWQYTEQARADVSSATLGVLRDFGFQG